MGGLEDLLFFEIFISSFHSKGNQPGPQISLPEVLLCETETKVAASLSPAAIRKSSKGLTQKEVLLSM